jgi:serine protease Do
MVWLDQRLTRIRRPVIAVLLVIGGSVLPTPARALPNRYGLADLQALEQAFIELADEVRPSVVAIRCYQVRDPSEMGMIQVRLPISQGTGLIIHGDGYIATNQHVIEDAHVISVTLHDGLQFDAELVQQDERTDLAVIRIEQTGLKPVRFGDYAGLRVNQWSFACGNPFGLAYDNEGESSITYGVVSALGRQMTRRLSADPQRRYYGNLIETSATINPGNSGGPLFNIEGEVIGIVVAIETSSGVSEGHGFAIPVDRNVIRVLDTLKTGEEVQYGFLGIEVNDVEPFLSRRVAVMDRPLGARITRIAPADGPAAKAKLQPEDIVIEFDGVPVSSSDHLVRLVQFTPVGTEVEVTYLRRQVKRKTQVVLADREDLLELAREGE